MAAEVPNAAQLDLGAERDEVSVEQRASLRWVVDVFSASGEACCLSACGDRLGARAVAAGAASARTVASQSRASGGGCDDNHAMPVVAHLLHSPVKGLALVERPSLRITSEGAPFDRCFFVVDAQGELAGSWSHGRLCLTRADYDGETLTLHLPDGAVVSAPDPVPGDEIALVWDSDEPAVGNLVEGPWAAALSDVLGEPVRLARVGPERGGWSAFAVSMIGDASIAALGHGPLDARRFRMGVGLTGGEPFEEDEWIGYDIAVGSTVLAVREPCARCVATTRDPATGERDFNALRAMIAERGAANLGIYCDVVQPGVIAVGDAVRVLGRSAA